jgi:hypothetical protein
MTAADSWQIWAKPERLAEEPAHAPLELALAA